MITPVRRNWSPKELFNGLTPAMFTAEPSAVRARWDKLWPDLYTEYDARYLKQELATRNLVVTAEAAAFLNAWAIDEERHTDGFIRIIELVANESEKDLRERLDARPHDFSPIIEHLKDEFSLMVMIAFDEMCTCRAYAAEKPFYDGLGNKTFHLWLREVIADEAVHSMNAVNVIRACYRDRIGQVGPILDNLIRASDNLRYCGTFVLDYFGTVYSKELLANSRLATMRNIAKPLTV
ncbi:MULTISPECIES: hypothetical protein [Bradyrhizobium]|uniref:Ferritin-like domain-containing protein n=1 Tax=Bradyrhizobium brasilense TaxID=1419277 RepID=A0ABY8JFP0_9BRAD|nr:hypothetical protein [Bradyrhizobium brasilense]WFU62788.1 hypothetical protein QA636_36000 [Bradyrhizobium brasilense]